MLTKLEQKMLEALPHKKEMINEHKDIVGDYAERSSFNEALSQCRRAISEVMEKAEVDKGKIDKIIDEIIGEDIGYYKDVESIFTKIAQAIATSSDIITIKER